MGPQHKCKIIVNWIIHNPHEIKPKHLWVFGGAITLPFPLPTHAMLYIDCKNVIFSQLNLESNRIGSLNSEEGWVMDKYVMGIPHAYCTIQYIKVNTKLFSNLLYYFLWHVDDCIGYIPRDWYILCLFDYIVVKWYTRNTKKLLEVASCD